jgi:hypothetical protein
MARRRTSRMRIRRTAWRGTGLLYNAPLDIWLSAYESIRKVNLHVFHMRETSGKRVTSPANTGHATGKRLHFNPNFGQAGNVETLA